MSDTTHITKNYMAHGGNEFVVGGKLTILEGAEITGFPAGAIPAAANQANSTATAVAGLKDDFNALLAKLKAAGLMTADAPDDNGDGNGDA